MSFRPSRYEVDPLFANSLQGLLPHFPTRPADRCIEAPWKPWTDYPEPIRVAAAHYAIAAPRHSVRSASLQVCHDVLYVTNGRDSGIIRDGVWFEGLGTGPSVEQTLDAMKLALDMPVKLAGRGLVLSDRFTGNNYCHWTMDWVPRMLLAQEIGGGFDWLFVRGSRKPFWASG